MYLARHRRKRAGGGTLGAALAAAALCAGGLGAAMFGLADVTPASAGATVTPASVTTAVPEQSPDPRARPLARSVPVRILIPAIGVSAPVMRLGRNPDGTVQVPPLGAHDLVGWYALGAAPGQRGAAVILGHVDSARGISVFFHLKDLRAGMRIYVSLADGKVAVFAVDGVQRVAKAAFPTQAVYGRARYPELRLITCGGPFDRTSGHYLDNIIVYAHLV
jgi:sortase (surface protein transpeptidase)